MQPPCELFPDCLCGSDKGLPAWGSQHSDVHWPALIYLAHMLMGNLTFQPRRLELHYGSFSKGLHPAAESPSHLLATSVSGVTARRGQEPPQMGTGPRPRPSSLVSGSRLGSGPRTHFLCSELWSFTKNPQVTLRLLMCDDSCPTPHSWLSQKRK